MFFVVSLVVGGGDGVLVHGFLLVEVIDVYGFKRTQAALYNKSAFCQNNPILYNKKPQAYVRMLGAFLLRRQVTVDETKSVGAGPSGAQHRLALLADGL